MTVTDARTVWQISAGPPSRTYAETFLRYAVGLIGPGDAGEWRPERSDEEFEGSFVRRFANEVQTGDSILLRTGLSKILAVGLVASPYQYLSAFDDVNGWDLQHGRRIRWSELPSEYDFGSSVFGANPPRLSTVQDKDMIDYALRYVGSPPTDWQHADLPGLPEEEPPLVEVPGELMDIVAEVQDLHPLMWDSDAFGEHPTEDELVARFVVPLLRALGWPPECIAVKWRYIDVAVFRKLPRAPENCQLVIEAKRLGAGVEGALEQAKGYVTALGLPVDVAVTDGVRYRMYASGLDFASVAYANLARLKRSATGLFERLRRP